MALTVSGLLLLAVVASTSALTCDDLGLTTRNPHPIVFTYTYNESRIPSRDGSAYIWAKSGEPDTSFSSEVSCSDQGEALVVRSTGIPDHNVGQFPFRRDTTGEGHFDNPNPMSEQEYHWRLPKTLTKKTTMPEPVTRDFNALPMGPIGFALNGVPFFNLYNDQRQDAVDPDSRGYEVMDLCMGHPQQMGAFHYHYTLSRPGCLYQDTPGQHSPKIGYAFDGIPIYGPLSDGGVPPTDLDVCNGRQHSTLGYIYHSTNKTSPYIIGCYRYVPIQHGPPPRQSVNGNGGTMFGGNVDQRHTPLPFGRRGPVRVN